MLSPHLNHMKEDDPFLDVEKTANEYMSNKEKKKMEKLNHGNRFLTTSEEEHIVKVCTRVAKFGFPVLFKMVGNIISRTVEKRLEKFNINVKHECSRQYVSKFLKRNSELCKLMKANSLDSVRADKITEEVRDALFAKLDSYVQILTSMGVYSQDVKGFADVDKSTIYNIDEIGMDTTKRTKMKVLADKKTVGWSSLFRKTFEGDGKMNKHVSVMVCSRADGK